MRGNLADRQAKMKARMEKQQQEATVEAHPKCQMPGCHRFARKGQPYCSRCTLKDFQEKLRDTLPGMPTGERREAAESEQNKADRVLQSPSLSNERSPVNQPDKYCVTNEAGNCISTDPRCMHQPKTEIPKQYTRKDVSKIVGVSMTTLMRWEKKGIVTPRHIAFGNKYIYTEEQLEEVRKYKEMEIPVDRSQVINTSRQGTLDDFARQRKAKFSAGKKVEKTVLKTLKTLHNLGGRLM